MSHDSDPVNDYTQDEHGAFRRVATLVYVKPAERGWYRVFVRYPGAAPALIAGTYGRDAAEQTARWFAAHYGWTFDSAASGGGDDA